MKKYIIIFLLFLATQVYADTKITELTNDAAPDGADLLITVDDVSGTPATKKATIANVLVDGNIPDTITIDAATALSSDPADCGANSFANVIAANGDLTCAQPAFTDLSGAATDAQIPDTITASNYLPLSGGTMTGSIVTDNLGVEFAESDTNPTCGAGDYHIYSDLSETTLKKCVNGVATDLDTDTTVADTNLTQEEVEDFAGGMNTGNTETLITVTYQDADGTVDYVVTPTLSSYTDDLTHTTDTTLDETGVVTLTGDWVNTANPWADNEVSDNITASAYAPLAGATYTGEVIFDNLGVDFTDSDTNPTCAAGDYLIYADLSETTLKKCINGSATDLDTGGAETNSLETLTTGIAVNEVLTGTASNTGVYKLMPDCNVAGSALNYEDSTQTWSCRSGFSAGGGLANVVEDTTPQLGGALDLNGNTLDNVTATELAELETIGATTISAAQWTGLGGATTAGIALWDDAAASNQLVTLGLTATASEINTPLDGASVTLTEFQELETIGATTVSANQWAALGGIAETLTFTELNLLDGITTLSGSNTGDDATNYESELDNSAGLAAALSDETGTGLAVFGTAPTFVTSITMGAASLSEAELEILDGATITTAETDTLTDGSDADSLHVHSGASLNDDVFLSNTGDVGTGVYDFGGATSIEIVNAAAPTTDALGEIALDTTIVDHQPLVQYYDGAENMTIIAIDTAELPALDNEIVKYDAATDKFVLEADAGAAGGDSISIDSSAVVDPDFVSTGQIDFVDTSNTVTANINDDSILEADLKAVDSPVDEECLTYESTTGDFEWQTCGGAGGGLTGRVDFSVQSAKITGAYVTATISGADTAAGASIDAGDGNWRLLFDDTTDEAAIWQFRIPPDYNGTPVAKIGYSMVSATASEVDWEVAVMCTSDGDSADVGTASFAAAATGSATVPGTVGYLDEVSITVTDDSCVAGDLMSIYVSTDANDATLDDATGDRELVYFQLEYASDGGAGGSSAYDDITAPDAGSAIVFGAFTNTWTSTAATDFFTIDGANGVNALAITDGNLSVTDLVSCDTIDTDASGNFSCGTDATGAGGSAITLDLGDDAGDDSVDLSEIATTGDTNSIFTESAADKLLIAVGSNWPTADLATTVTTNANLTGPITSSGNATSIAAQTGTGTTFVVDTSPTLVTPTIGVATATSINKVAITAPATASTLTIADGQTLTVNGSATITSGAHSGTNTGDQTTISGNAGTATALAANGGNCSAGSAPLGVDASGAAETCTDYEEDLSNEAGLYAALSDVTNFLQAGDALGTPASGVATNLTGTAAGLTAGNVTTNANLTGEVTSVGNAAVITESALQENGASELVGESLGTACTNGQVLKANGTGGLDCGADADSGGATAYDDIGDPDGDGALLFTSFTNTWTSTLAGTFFTIDGTDGNTAVDIVDGDLSVTDTILTGVGIDAVGAVDMDYGSADVTDHTFLADGATDADFVVPNDSIGPAEMADATLTTAGDIEIATAAETTTGTDAARAVSPDGLAGSDFGKKVVTLWVLDDSEDHAVADGSGDLLWRVPATLTGYNLVDVECYVQTAGTTGTATIQVHNVTDTADMLSTKCTIDTTETDSSTAVAAPVIDGTNDDVVTGDKIRIDVDVIQTTAAKGLGVELTFQLP